MGDHAAANVLRRFSTTVRSSASHHGGRIVKQIGDAFMLCFAHPTDAIEFGLTVDQFVDTESQFPALHIGAHHGPVLYRDGDYIGATVNLAARVAAAGAAEQFLITEDLRDAATNLTGVDFVALPPRRLKGLPEPIRLVQVRRHLGQRADRETDPVCGLLLHPNEVATRATWQGVSYAFCCEICQQAFTENPARFTAENHP
jgi:adenylate cyclase